MKLLLKNWGFWSIIANVVLTATIIIMAIVWSNHECPTFKTEHFEREILESKLKIKKYEKQITVDSLIIWASNRSERDSLRAVRFKNYMR